MSRWEIERNADGSPAPIDRDEFDAAHGIERVVTDPTLHEPILVVMMTGWIDAAGAAAATVEHLSRACLSTPVLTFDDDTYIDFRARRPTMQLRNGLNTDLEWATIEMRSGRSADGRDLLFLIGPEPDMAWRRFGRAVARLAVDFGVTKMVSLGAYPFAAPHTRPSRLSVSSASTDVLASVSFARSSVDVPAGMAGVLEHAMQAQRIPALGIWAQVPHYVSTLEYPAASIALLEGFHEVTGVETDTTGLQDEVREQRARLDDMIADKPEHAAMVRQLEELHDLVDDQDADAGPVGDELQLRSGDELAAEIQQFFRDQR